MKETWKGNLSIPCHPTGNSVFEEGKEDYKKKEKYAKLNTHLQTHDTCVKHICNIRPTTQRGIIRRRRKF